VQRSLNSVAAEEAHWRRLRLPTATPEQTINFSRKLRRPGFSFSGAGGFNNGPGKRSRAGGGNDTRIVSSIAATGFGLTALCIGAQRGYQSERGHC